MKKWFSVFMAMLLCFQLALPLAPQAAAAENSDFEQELQSENAWRAGESYPVTAGLSDAADTLEASVLESPIAELKIQDILLPEKDIARYREETYNPDTREYEPVPGYSIYSSDLDFVAKLKDGTELKSDNGGLAIDGKWYYPEISHNQSSEPWVLGGTYTATASIFGVDYPFSVTIVENPKKIVSLEVEDTAIMDGMYDYNDPYDEYTVYAPDFTVTLNDGTKLHADNGWIDTEDMLIRLNYSDVQPEQWKLGETHTVTASFQDLSDTFQVTVVESCIEKVAFSDATVIAGAGGSMTSYYDADTGKTEEYFHYAYHPAFTVTFKDGTEKTFRYPDGMRSAMLFYRTYGMGGFFSYGHFPRYTDRQQEEHWEVGGTYPVSVSFMGFSDTIQVTVIENPVQSIVPDEMLLVRERDGYAYWYQAQAALELDLHRYEEPSYTVTLKDGTVLQTEYGIDGTLVEIYGEYYSVCSDYTLPTAPGDYDLPVKVSAFGDEYDVAVPVKAVVSEAGLAEALGIEKIEIEDIQAISQEDGYYTISPAFTFVMKDGRRIPDSAAVYVWALDIEGGNYASRPDWQVGGTYTLTGSIFGLTDTFTVAVIENPIESLLSTDITCVNPDIYEYGFSYQRDAGQFRYVNPFLLSSSPVLQFRLKDGSVVDASIGDPHNYDLMLYNNRYSFHVYVDELAYEYGKAYDGRFTLLGDEYELSVTFLEASPGDLDGDGEATIADVMEACKVMARESAGTDPTDHEIACGDLDGDGEITIADVMEICKILARQDA